jgi:shikimate kinase
MQRLALVGFMGSGKTTVGRKLAMQLNVSFIDLDSEIVRITGWSIPEIFSTYGEDTFRKYEYQVLCDISSDGKTCVLATGGGIITQEATRTILNEKYYVVYLDVSLDTALERIRKDGSTRPLANETSDMVVRLKNLLQRRRPFYESVADFSYKIQSQGIQQIVSDIVNHLNQDPKWNGMKASV